MSLTNRNVLAPRNALTLNGRPVTAAVAVSQLVGCSWDTDEACFVRPDGTQLILSGDAGEVSAVRKAVRKATTTA